MCLAWSSGCGNTGGDSDASTGGDVGTQDPATGATGSSGGEPTSPGPTGDEPTSAGDPTSDGESSGEGTTAGEASSGGDPTGDPTGDPSGDPSGDPTGDPPPALLPPPDAGLDYQLGGAYPPPRGVGVLSRDRKEAPAQGLYNVCYVNGFQAQPDDESFWLDEHPDLILRDADDKPVIDQDWDEMLLDTSTPEKRAALAEIVGGWIAGCGAAGYQAIEIDNLDSYSRSQDLLDQDQAVAYMALLSAAAHAGGMAIAQKNSTELLPRRAEMGTDFAVSEECNHYDECGDYIATYGDAVLMIEYSDADFMKGCADYPQISIVRRDVDLTMPGDAAYKYDAC